MIVGTVLGRYELLEQLGEGGMGTVWLARLTGAAGFEKLCIVKTVLPSIAKDAEFVSRFLHEGRVLTQLSHGNIAQVLDMNEVDGQLFLALEYVAGVDLARLHEQVRAAQEYMPLDLVVALITQAAEGLGAAHRKAALDGSPLNIVHRDVSPHNIMVSYEGEVKVIDFGIAKSEARSRHTAQASVMGKLGYMAPEQARGEPVDHRADQFALSIVLWELLANQSWVKRGTLTEMVVAMAHPPSPRALTPLRTDVPASLEAVVLKALSPLPEGRFATTDEFAQALMGELLKLGPPPTKPQLGQYVRSRCSTDFATQRQLLTRVSTQRSPPPEGERPKVDLFAETAVRSPPPVPTTPNAAVALKETGVPTMVARPPATVPMPATPTVSLSPVEERADAQSDPAYDKTALPALSRPAVTAPTDPEFPVVAPPSLADTTIRPESAPESPAVVSRTPSPAETSPARPSVIAAPQSLDAASQAAGPAVTSPSRPGVVAAPAPSMTTGEMAAAISPKRSVLVPVLGVVAVLAIGAAAFFALRQGGPEVVAAIDAGVSEPTKVPELVIAPVEAVVDAGPLEAFFDAGSVVAPPPLDASTFRVSARLAGNTWFVTNQDRHNGTRCRMTLPGQRVISIGTMPRGTALDLPVKRFRFDAKAPPLTTQARVDCDQGFGLIDVP